MTDAPDRQAPPAEPISASQPAPVPVRPLEYFDPPQEGWTGATRLVLLFMAIYAGARLFGGIAYLMLLMGQGMRAWPPAISAVLLTEQTVVPLAVLLASLVALTSRRNAARLAAVWCTGVWIAATLVVPVVTIVQWGTFPRSMTLTVRAGYYLNALMNGLVAVVMPVLTIVLLTRAPVRRQFAARS